MRCVIENPNNPKPPGAFMKIFALVLFLPLSAQACEIESAQILARVVSDSTYVYGGHCPVEV